MRPARRRHAARAIAVAGGLVGGLGCDTRAPTTDDELPGLVVAPRQAPRAVDVDLAARDAAELLRALGQHHDVAGAALGPHATTIKSDTTVREGTTVVDHLVVDTVLELGADGAFHARSDNSADYGNEVIFVGGMLYDRPRYARWHGRPPNDDAEPLALRDRFVGELAAGWDLVAPGAELTDRGPSRIAGRTARTLAVKLAPSPRPNPAEPLSQRAWRASRTIDAVAGELVLDAASGVPLSGTLTGTVSFTRDGRRFTMTVDVRLATSSLGVATAIAAPPADETVATPVRRGEVDERDALLKGIAPPARPRGPGADEATTAPGSSKP